MKKKLKILIFAFLILTSFINFFSTSHALTPSCYDLFDQIKNEWREKKLHEVDYQKFIDYGFEAARDNLAKNQPNLRSKKNHFIVGLINDPSLIGKVKRGDIIISVGDVDTSTVSDSNDYTFFAELGDIETVKFSRNGKEFELELPKIEKLKVDQEIQTVIKNISNVDIKNFKFTVKMHTLAEAYHNVYEDNPGLADLVLKNLIYKYKDEEKKEEEWDWTGCEYLDLKLFKELRLPIPGEDIFIENTLFLNKNLISSKIDIWPYSPRIGDPEEQGEYAKIVNLTKGTYEIQNNFKLQTFPFDKQVLTISYLSPLKIDTYEISNKFSSYRNLEHFIKNENINGWDMTGYDLNNKIIKNERGEFVSGVNIEIYIERQHGYYIYKVLIPILLILMVCWSVVWVDPKQLESRLTITIVCLLSLIAYNFVIDSELPKLEYLTVMDWIILVSYFYATIPNFISVISFRLYKTNRPLSDKIELYSKKYGASSYIVLILIIVLINANLFPENSSTMISWMAGR